MSQDSPDQHLAQNKKLLQHYCPLLQIPVCSVPRQAIVEQALSMTSSLSAGFHRPAIEKLSLVRTDCLQHVPIPMEEWIRFSDSRLETLPLSHESKQHKTAPCIPLEIKQDYSLSQSNEEDHFVVNESGPVKQVTRGRHWIKLIQPLQREQSKEQVHISHFLWPP